MFNLRKKILLIVSLLFISVQTILGVNASEYYTFHTREFLRNLGCRSYGSVPIKKMSRNDKLYNGTAGYSNGTEIYLNEDFFGKQWRSKGANLFTCAHEAAHHALGHAYQVRRNSLQIEQEADETAARMLCNNGYRWVVEAEVSLLKQLVNSGQGGFTDGKHPTTQQQYVYLSKILATNRGTNNTGNAGVGRNPNVNNGRKGSNAKSGRDSRRTNPEYYETYEVERDHRPFETAVEEFKGFLRQFNNLSREQKMVVAGILGAWYMGWIKTR